MHFAGVFSSGGQNRRFVGLASWDSSTRGITVDVEFGVEASNLCKTKYTWLVDRMEESTGSAA